MKWVSKMIEEEPLAFLGLVCIVGIATGVVIVLILKVLQ